MIVGVIALISWLSNKAKEAQQARAEEAGGGDAPAGRGEGTVRAEIDRFLREVGGGRKRREEAADDAVIQPDLDEPILEFARLVLRAHEDGYLVERQAFTLQPLDFSSSLQPRPLGNAIGPGRQALHPGCPGCPD